MIYFLTLIDDEDARDYFEEIYNQYHNMMFICALKMMKNRHDAEDALQQVLLNLWKYMSNVRKVSDKKLRSYLYITTKNYCSTLLERSKSNRLINLDDFPEWELAAENNPEMIAIENFNKHVLMEALNELSPNYRQIIIDKAILHLDDRQAAEHIGIKVTYVRECLSRARAILRKLYLKKLGNCEAPSAPDKK